MNDVQEISDSISNFTTNSELMIEAGLNDTNILEFRDVDVDITHLYDHRVQQLQKDQNAVTALRLDFIENDDIVFLEEKHQMQSDQLQIHHGDV